MASRQCSQGGLSSPFIWEKQGKPSRRRRRRVMTVLWPGHTKNFSRGGGFAEDNRWRENPRAEPRWARGGKFPNPGEIFTSTPSSSFLLYISLFLFSPFPFSFSPSPHPSTPFCSLLFFLFFSSFSFLSISFPSYPFPSPLFSVFFSFSLLLSIFRENSGENSQIRLLLAVLRARIFKHSKTG